MSELVAEERIAPEIVRLTLQRAEKKNALSLALRDAVSERLEALGADRKLKVLILTGAGAAFSAGFDLAEFGQASNDPAFHAALWASSDRYHRLLLHFPLPTLAAVNGLAFGGGFDTAVLCDIRVAAASASFAHPEVAFADVVYGPLHDLVGGAVARDLCLTGRRIDAEEALRLNLVSAVVPDADLGARAVAMAQAIARGPREVLMRTKAKAIARAGIAFRTTLEL